MKRNNSVLTEASRQWASRPDDERFTSLLDMRASAVASFERADEHTLAIRDLELVASDDKTLMLTHTKKGELGEPTNWGFQQLTEYGDAAASTMRTRPAPMVAQWLNYGLKRNPRGNQAKILQRPTRESLFAGEAERPGREVAAFTSANYGRVWDVEVLDQLIDRFGDGVSGDWRVPGEFGKAVHVTKENTTLYWSDRSMFVFLANEQNRIQVQGRRKGLTGSLARGFFFWNSEVGAETLGFKSFLFDYVCSNRIVWGASDVKTIKIKHSRTAPMRFMNEVQPQLILYANQTAKKEEATIARAQQYLLEDHTKGVVPFISKHFGPRSVDEFNLAHIRAEERPIETLWDVVCAATEVAKKIPHQDRRVALETKAGLLLDLVAE